jgi:hypothetical protein
MMLSLSMPIMQQKDNNTAVSKQSQTISSPDPNGLVCL